MKIATHFWKAPPNVVRDKLVDMIYWDTVIIILTYITTWLFGMAYMNILLIIFLLNIVMLLSYRKYRKELPNDESNT